MYTLEPLSEQHRKGVIEVFNYFIENSFAAYRESRVGYEMFDTFLADTRGYPAYAVLSEADEVVGFGFMAPHKAAPTFRRTADLTYFFLPEHTGKGIGKMLLERFVEEGREMGIDTLMANISSHNEQSLSFHRKCGFEEVGRFKVVGRKFGQDFDVVWMERKI